MVTVRVVFTNGRSKKYYNIDEYFSGAAQGRLFEMHTANGDRHYVSVANVRIIDIVEDV